MMRRAVSIQDIAQAAGVSHATVSRALRDNPLISVEVRGTIQRLASEMGYTPNAVAQSLKGQRSNTIGLVMTSIADPFYGRVARGVDEVARQAGLDVFLGVSYNNAEQELAVIESFHRRRVDGILTASSRLTERPHGPTASHRGAGGDDQPAIRKRPHRVSICPGRQLRRRAIWQPRICWAWAIRPSPTWAPRTGRTLTSSARRAIATPYRLPASRSRMIGSRRRPQSVAAIPMMWRMGRF